MPTLTNPALPTLGCYTGTNKGSYQRLALRPAALRDILVGLSTVNGQPPAAEENYEASRRGNPPATRR